MWRVPLSVLGQRSNFESTHLLSLGSCLDRTSLAENLTKDLIKIYLWVSSFQAEKLFQDIVFICKVKGIVVLNIFLLLMTNNQVFSPLYTPPH